MPKEKTALKDKIKKWLVELDHDTQVFQQQMFNDDSVFCRACGKVFKCTKKCHIEQHQKGPTHKQKVRNPERQLLLESCSQAHDMSNFNTELCQALLGANIPLYKLKNKNFSQFLEKYCQKTIPDESTLRKNYIPKCYEKILENIRKYIGNESIWIAVDETTDPKGRNIAHIIVGKLSHEESSKPMLLDSTVLEKTNNITISRFVNESLAILWPMGVKHDKVKLFLSDSAPYMVKSGQNLKIFYPNLIHVTCLAHALNLVCEIIRTQNEEVNLLISSIKKIFLKAPLRVEAYKQHLPDVPLPPEPILTRWGTWIETAIFYADNFEGIKEIVESFDATNSQAIKTAQEILLKNKNILNKLRYIKCHFEILVTSIKKLETVGMTLVDSVSIIENVLTALKETPGETGKAALNKLELVLNKNPDYDKLLHFKNLMSGEEPPEEETINWHKHKFAPITSYDAERSFSLLGNVLTDKRTGFTPDNLKQYMVCQANAKKF